MEVALSTREREQLETLRRARAGSGEPYSTDEHIRTLLRRDSLSCLVHEYEDGWSFPFQLLDRVSEQWQKQRHKRKSNEYT